MTVKFYKYQGTGNDFIIIDNRHYGLTKDVNAIQKLCHRKFGIGADGLIYLQDKEGYDFEMVYFNSDGNESSMCGNGGRCIIKFAYDLGLTGTHCRFMAIDGEHEGEILNGSKISLKMKNVNAVEAISNDFVLNTGSPHYVRFVSNVQLLPLVEDARKIRFNERFAAEGINVNFVERKNDNEIYVRTYERGVEDETLSCGTGVVASAISLAIQKETPCVYIETPGGQLEVNFKRVGNNFSNILLIGPAEKVFEGTLTW